MTCAACGVENDPGRKFCKECGARLSLACPSCGAANASDDKFCGECGSPLVQPPGGATATPSSTAVAGAATGRDSDTERRMVSVLFVDLVGFTTFSEGRDAEDVRAMLTRYFDAASDAVQRHGGAVEKFIGDAVMAVWGTPVAHEDDAERAVRSALEIVDRVEALGSSLGIALQARAGVHTGEAIAVLSAVDQGFVTGRHGQHRGATAVGCRAGDRARRRAHVPFGVGVDRLRAGRAADTQGQVRAGAGVAGAARHQRARRFQPRQRARAALRRARRGAAPGEGTAPRDRPRGSPEAAAHQWRRGHRQVAAGVGAAEVRRRPDRDLPVASGQVPVLRRRRHVLGARRDGAHPRPHRRHRRLRDGPRPPGRMSREVRASTSTSGAGSSRSSATSSASRARRSTATSCSGPGDASSSASPSRARS